MGQQEIIVFFFLLATGFQIDLYRGEIIDKTVMFEAVCRRMGTIFLYGYSNKVPCVCQFTWHRENPAGYPAKRFRNRTLVDICQEYNLNISTVLRGLSENNIRTSTDANTKQIAEQNHVSSSALYTIIENVANQNL